jgi:hypothetical protein
MYGAGSYEVDAVVYFKNHWGNRLYELRTREEIGITFWDLIEYGFKVLPKKWPYDHPIEVGLSLGTVFEFWHVSNEKSGTYFFEDETTNKRGYDLLFYKTYTFYDTDALKKDDFDEYTRACVYFDMIENLPLGCSIESIQPLSDRSKKCISDWTQYCYGIDGPSVLPSYYFWAANESASECQSHNHNSPVMLSDDKENPEPAYITGHSKWSSVEELNLNQAKGE